MEYTTLGKSGIKISRICLGAMTFGCGDMVLEGKTTPTPWLLNQEQTDEMVKTALDNGINFFDTANVYNSGTSEIFLGKSIKKFAKREDVVIATMKENYPLKQLKENVMNLSRGWILLTLIYI